MNLTHTIKIAMYSRTWCKSLPFELGDGCKDLIFNSCFSVEYALGQANKFML